MQNKKKEHNIKQPLCNLQMLLGILPTHIRYYSKLITYLPGGSTFLILITLYR